MNRMLLVEDEAIAARRLQKMVESLNKDLVIVEVIDSVVDLKSFLNKHSVDLILSDIHLSDGLCFDAYKQFTELPPIIFCTAYDEYALRAFKFSGIDYLLKPIKKEELETALEKYTSLYCQKDNPIAQVSDYLSSEKSKTLHKLLSKVGHQIHVINVEQIDFIYSENKYSFAVTQEGKEFLIDHSLQELEDLLDHSEFFRINRQVIVNISAVSKMIPSTSSRLELVFPGYQQLNTTVSKTKTPEFKRWIER